MSQEKSFRASGLEFRIEHRTFGGDGGPALRVFGDVDGKPVQLLRFDCFIKNPHYHYDPSGRNEQHPLDKEEVPDPIAWTIDRLEQNLAEMIRKAGYDDIAEKVDPAAVAAVVPEIEVVMRG